MNFLLLISLALLALAPSFISLFLILYKIEITKTKRILLIKLLMASILSFVIAALLPGVGAWFFKLITKNSPGIVAMSFFMGPTEEGSNLLVVLWLVWRSREFKNFYDAIIYSSVVAIGFATLENILCIKEGLTTILQRFIISSPAHLAFGVMMGYFIGKARFSKTSAEARIYLLKGLLLLSLLHALFDVLVFNTFTLRIMGILMVPFFIAATFKIIQKGRKLLQER